MGDFSKLAFLATRQHGLLTTDQLVAAGYSKRMVAGRVRNGEFDRAGRGVIRIAGASPTWEQKLLSAVLMAEPVSCASHRAAARLWGFRSVDSEIEVSIRYPRNFRGSVDGIVHRSVDLDACDITEVNGIPVTTPERTICDLGLIFPQHEVARILRHAISQGLVLPRDLWMIRQRTSKQGRNGTGVLERILDALPDDFDRVESGLELHFLELCEQAGLPAPAVQLPLRVGGKNYRLDFAWARTRLFVEIDGVAFHSTAEQISNDRARQNALVQAGWTPLRFTHLDLTQRPLQTLSAVRKGLDF